MTQKPAGYSGKPLYQKLGFSPVRVSDEEIEPWD